MKTWLHIALENLRLEQLTVLRCEIQKAKENARKAKEIGR